MIVLDHVTKTFGQRMALHNVSIHFEAGQTHVLLGSSGCGKSTILRMILGLLPPDSGEVRVNDTRIGNTKPFFAGPSGVHPRQSPATSQVLRPLRQSAAVVRSKA